MQSLTIDTVPPPSPKWELYNSGGLPTPRRTAWSLPQLLAVLLQRPLLWSLRHLKRTSGMYRELACKGVDWYYSAVTVRRWRYFKWQEGLSPCEIIGEKLF